MGCSTEKNLTATEATAINSEQDFSVTVLAVEYAEGYGPAGKIAGVDSDAKKAARQVLLEARQAARQAEAAVRQADRDAAKAARLADREAAKAAREAARVAREAEREAKRIERQAEREAKRIERQAKLEAKDLENRFDSKEIGPHGGSLRVGSLMGAGGQDNIRAVLKVPNGALAEPLELTMELQGSTLSTINIVFGPALVFDLPATLVIHLGRKAIDLDLDAVVALHVSDDLDGDGQPDLVEEVPIRMAHGVLGLELQIAVPGFSRYSMGGGS